MEVKQLTVLAYIGDNSTPVTLSWDESAGAYTASVQAPNFSTKSTEEGYIPVSIKAADKPGNSTTITTSGGTVVSGGVSTPLTHNFADDLKLYVKEVVKPTVKIDNPSADSYVTENKVKVVFTLSDMPTDDATGYSGFDINRSNFFTFIIDDVEYTYEALKTAGILDMDNIEVTPSNINGGGYAGKITVSAELINLEDGLHTIGVKCIDEDENASDVVTRTFNVDTIRPDLNEVKINGSSDEMLETNEATVSVSGKTNDTSKPIVISIYVNDNKYGDDVIPEDDGTFKTNVTFTEDGVYTVKVVATDAAGQFTAVERTVVYDTNAPEFISVVIDPGNPDGNPAIAGGFYTITVKVR